MKTKANRVRPHGVSVRFTEDEFRIVQAAANANFTSIGSYVRQRLLQPLLSNQASVQQ